jgi:hypothetical protein
MLKVLSREMTLIELGPFMRLSAAFMVGFGKIEAAVLLRFASMPQDFL